MRICNSSFPIKLMLNSQLTLKNIDLRSISIEFRYITVYVSTYLFVYFLLKINYIQTLYSLLVLKLITSLGSLGEQRGFRVHLEGWNMRPMCQARMILTMKRYQGDSGEVGRFVLAAETRVFRV